MNPERVFNDVVEVVRDYVRARSSTAKKADGQSWSTGMTLLSENDKRVEEIARLVTEAVMRCDDGRARMHVEAKELKLGDHFTRYAIKDGVGVDEEVVVLKAGTSAGRTTVRYRRHGDAQSEVTLDSTYLIAVYRPTIAELRAELGADS